MQYRFLHRDSLSGRVPRSPCTGQAICVFVRKCNVKPQQLDKLRQKWGGYFMNYYTRYTKNRGERMENKEQKYWELLGIVEEAQNEMRRMAANLQKLPDEMFDILHNLNKYTREPDQKYFGLAANVRRASEELKQFKGKWEELEQSLEAVRFQFFLAEAHVLMNLKDKRTRSERHKEWEKRYRNY